MKDFENVVKNATNTWKNVYLLHKPSNFLLSISDKDDKDDQEKDEEGNDEEIINFDTIDDEEEQEQEATEEGTEDDEETDPVKIAATIIASLPYSPRKPMTTSSIETSPPRLIVITSDNKNVQSLFSLVYLSTLLTNVISTSST